MDDILSALLSLAGKVTRGESTLAGALRQIAKSLVMVDEAVIRTIGQYAEDERHGAVQVRLVLARFCEYMSRRVANPQLTGRCALLVGSLAKKAGDLELAVKWSRQAVRWFERSGDQVGLALAEQAIGEVLLATRRSDEALHHFERALQLFRQTGYRAGEADTLLSMGMVLFDHFHAEEALARYQEALWLYREMKEHQMEAHTLNLMGSVLTAQGRPDESLEHYRASLGLYQQLGMSQGVADAYTGIAWSHGQRLEYDEALTQFAKALQLYERLDIPGRAAKVLYGMGNVHWMRSEFDEAEQCYHRAQALWRQANDRQGEARISQVLGQLLRQRGDLDQAIDCYQAAVTLTSQLGDLRGLATAHRALGELFAIRFEHDVARRHYERALELFRRTGNLTGQAHVLQGLGHALAFQGEKKQALEHYETALRLAGQAGDITCEAGAWEAKGHLYVESEPVQALECYAKALGLIRRATDDEGEANILTGIATALTALGRYDLATASLTEALTLARKRRDSLGCAKARRALAKLLDLQGDSGRALTEYRRALRAFGEAQSRSGIIETRLAMGQLLLNQGRYREAYTHVRSAVHELERSMERQPWERTRRSVSGWGAAVYRAMVETCLALGRTEEAWRYCVRAKGRVLLDLLGSAQPHSKRTPTQAAYAAWAHAAHKLQQFEEDAEAAGGERLALLQAEEFGLRQQLIRLMDEGRELVQVKVPSARRLGSSLRQLVRGEQLSPGRALLVEYFMLGAGRYVVFLFPLWEQEQSGSLPLLVKEVDVGRDAVERLLVTYGYGLDMGAMAGRSRSNLSPKPTEIAPSDGEQRSERVLTAFAAVPEELGRLFVEPWADLLRMLAPTELVLVPHAILHELPLHAAMLNGRPLLEHHNLVYLPTVGLAGGLLRRPRKKQRPKRHLVLGPPHRHGLPGAEAEAAELADLLGEPPHRYEQMKVQVLRETAGDVSTLHLATHSRFDLREYSHSYIQFHRERLTLFDLMADQSLSLEGVRLVYLSSCESGRAKLDVADNLQGMVWTLIRAGAGAVMASLWPVDDLAARIVALRFYHHLKGGASIMDAYCRAVRDLMQESKYSNPYFWAPFILWGDGFQRDVLMNRQDQTVRSSN